MFQPSSFHGHGEAGCVKLEVLYLHSEGKCIATVKAYLAYHGPGCYVVEASWQCSINAVNFIKWKEARAMVEKQLKKREQKSPLMVALFCPCLAQSQVSCCISF